MVISELQSWITIAESPLHQAIHFCDDATMIKKILPEYWKSRLTGAREQINNLNVNEFIK